MTKPRCKNATGLSLHFSCGARQRQWQGPRTMYDVDVGFWIGLALADLPHPQRPNPPYHTRYHRDTNQPEIRYLLLIQKSLFRMTDE
jgi:hypothetical protein